MKKKVRILLNLFVALSMIFTFAATQSAPQVVDAAAIQQTEPPPPDRPDKGAALLGRDALQRDYVSELEAEPAIKKIDPILRDAVQAGESGEVKIYVATKGGANLSKYLTDIFERPAVFAGIKDVYGTAQVSSLMKIAQEPGTLAIVAVGQPLDKPYDPETNNAPDLAAKQARINELLASELTYAEAQANASDIGARGWFDVLDGHKSKQAWEKGFTGEGVVVGVLDDGIDFAHPDLQGTYARVTDGDSPYYGWPMAFSQVSTLYFYQDIEFDVSGIADGWNGSRWSDTQETFEASPSFEGGTTTYMYQPLGSGVAYQYTIPLTSASGFYKIGSHPDRNLENLYGHRVAVLVVDEGAPGNYDTVYVDLDNDKDFTDEKPVTKESPEVYRDMNGDGYADISGGLLVWISDGDNTPPTADWLWGITCSDSSSTMKGCPDSGELLIFAGPFDAGYTHGTQCASNIAGQGVVSGGLTAQPFAVGGMVQGGAPEVGLMDFGNHYFSGTDEDEFIVAALGYDGVPNSGDEVQITSNSYGNFRQMWGGWGYFGRLITALNTTVAPKTVWLFSAGNEGPGYGPQEGDGGPTTIQVGSSTQYGSTNWDSIVSADQIMYGDVTAFFSHGPNNDGSSGLDVLANGGRGSGDEGLNYFGYDGATSWDTWGGTSRSSPVAAGNLALAFQAYKERYGEWPTWDVAKALLKNGADNPSSSPFLQGGGVVNADRTTDLAAGLYGVYATPNEWQVGDWEGVDYLNFANVAYAGETYSTTYTVSNPSGYDIDVNLSDGVMELIDSQELEFTTSSQSEESNFNFHSPDYLMELDPSMIPADTELMVVRYVHPYDTFDPVYDFTPNPNSSWRFLFYNWTDVNGDGMLWQDTNGNGVVNHVDNLALGQDNDGFYRPDYNDPGTEIQQGEYVRVDYDFGSLDDQLFIRDPLERMADGYFFGFQHRYNDGTIDHTTITIGVEFYKRADWDWLSLSDSSLTVPAESDANFVATMALPGDTAPGAYEGVIFMDDPGDAYHDAHETALPVVVNVIADLENGASVTMGGEAKSPTLYDNSWSNGYFTWYGGGWTGAGDWRHYFLNVDEADVAKGNMLVHTSWDAGYPTDFNTWILGPTQDCASNGAGPCAWYSSSVGQPNPNLYGPYTLQPITSSGPFISGTAYPFDTSTGGPDDWLLAPFEQAGLHEIALHNVLYDGEQLATQFQVDVGTIEVGAEVDPQVGSASFGSIDADVYTDTGQVNLWFTPTLEIPGMVASLSGGLETSFFGPFTSFVPDSGQCYSAWCSDNVYEPFIVDQVGATELYVHLDVTTNQDADFFLVYDVDDNGIAEQGVDSVVGSSGNSSGTDEEITLANPTLGRYFAVIDGYDVDPDSGVNLDWDYSVTAPGNLPTEENEVYSDTVSIDQDATFDPATASFSMTVTTSARTNALHFLLTEIPTDTADVDLYLTNEAGEIVAKSQTDQATEHIKYDPPEGQYRFTAGEEYTVWVHGFDVPSGPVTPHLRVWTDELNVWLSSTHPDVMVDAIGAGEAVSVTLNFEKDGWAPGDPDLSARITAGPTVLPEAFDELILLNRTDAPDPDAWNPANLDLAYTVESARGPSPFVPWPSYAETTVLGDNTEVVTWTLTVTNNDPHPVSLELEPELDNWTQWNYLGDPYFQQTFDSIVETPTIGTCARNVPFWVDFDVTLDPGESSTCAWRATTDAAMDVLDDHLSFVWEFNVFGGALTASDVYYRSFRMTDSYKMSNPGSVAAGDTFSYEISLMNPSAVDREIMLTDQLPEEVEFVSASAGMNYDAASHTVTWDGLLPGTTLSTLDFEITVMANGDLDEGTWLENDALITFKFEDEPYTTLTAMTLIDDGLNPDLSIEKTVDSLIGHQGETLSYTIMVMNDGDETAHDVMVQDALPDEVTYVEGSLSGSATITDGVISWMGDLAPGGSATITFEATVNADAPGNLALINAATAEVENYYNFNGYNSAVTEILPQFTIILPVIER
jgi:uncharacterized repeat protein (TIGR01451 family)